MNVSRVGKNYIAVRCEIQFWIFIHTIFFLFLCWVGVLSSSLQSGGILSCGCWDEGTGTGSRWSRNDALYEPSLTVVILILSFIWGTNIYVYGIGKYMSVHYTFAFWFGLSVNVFYAHAHSDWNTTKYGFILLIFAFKS